MSSPDYDDHLYWAAAADPHADQIARDSPEQIEQYWSAYRNRIGDDAPDVDDFAEYVRHLQITQERPTAGEWNLAFERGVAGEIVLTELGQPNEPGIDLITYDPQDDWIRLFDDKSVADKVTQVSALDENLLTNIARAIDDIAPLRGDADIGTYAEDAVHRLTEAFERIAEVGTAPDRHDLIADALDELHISRVVANTAGPAELHIDESLHDRRFRSADTD